MRKFLWYVTAPFDPLATLLSRLTTKWRWWRLDLSIDQEKVKPLIEEFSAHIDKGREGYTYEVEVFIAKNKEVMDIGFHFMEFMDQYGDDAPNHVSVSSLAPDGKLYTLTVERDTSKPKHIIINELKERIAELERSTP